ncbi:unnamed protein product [Paramecium primaurelia]|uniref:Transmembrane protein n=1 Tax=Paramecium primaurelia TaxID=5886 RepID=A0A8S1N6U8_PARPR|nr:unnamed protein product [Paramecium primaurelia]
MPLYSDSQSSLPRGFVKLGWSQYDNQSPSEHHLHQQRLERKFIGKLNHGSCYKQCSIWYVYIINNEDLTSQSQQYSSSIYITQIIIGSILICFDFIKQNCILFTHYI